jgi:TRAP-type C4-dicarboxylate transport system substrate-binding protein
MFKLSGFVKTSALVGAVAVVWALPAGAAQVTLRTVSSLPKSIPVAASFHQNFLPRAKEAGKGHYTIDFKGGPEVIPPRKGAMAVKRGSIDMLWGPAGYYAGTVPEAYALMGSQKPVQTLWANGGMDMLNKVWAKRLNARILAWGESRSGMNIYTQWKPKITDNGPDLTGKKMRTTPTYKGLLSTLGATPIRMSGTEIYTGLQRKVIDGFAWTKSGLTVLGLAKITKYRVDPSFYRANSVVIINLNKWRALSQTGRDALNKASRDYERISLEYMAKESVREAKELTKSGLTIITLEPATAKRYLKVADDAMWRRFDELVKGDAAKLKAKFRGR